MHSQSCAAGGSSKSESIRRVIWTVASLGMSRPLLSTNSFTMDSSQGFHGL